MALRRFARLDEKLHVRSRESAIPRRDALNQRINWCGFRGGVFPSKPLLLRQSELLLRRSLPLRDLRV
jgi:hypothetical protein